MYSTAKSTKSSRLRPVKALYCCALVELTSFAVLPVTAQYGDLVGSVNAATWFSSTSSEKKTVRDVSFGSTSVGERIVSHVPRECRKLQSIPESSPSWVPQPGKYLLLLCTFGQLSNQMQCVRNTLRVAATLNRTLLIPPASLAWVVNGVRSTWAWDVAIDLPRARRCLEPSYGHDTILTFEEYLAHRNASKVVVRRMHCPYRGATHHCFRPRKLRAIQRMLRGCLVLPPMTQWRSWIVPSALPQRPPPREEDIARVFGSVQDKVLLFGELFAVFLRPPDVRHALALPPACRNLWRPHAAVMGFVEGLIRTKLGPHFAALHLRRGDFYTEAMRARGLNITWSGYATYMSLVDVAAAVGERLGEAGIQTLFVSSDGRKLELRLLRDMLAGPSSPRPGLSVVTLPQVLADSAWLAAQSWAGPVLKLVERGRMTSPEVVWALVDKFVCTRAEVFMGCRASSFSRDIRLIRAAEGFGSRLDSEIEKS